MMSFWRAIQRKAWFRLAGASCVLAGAWVHPSWPAEAEPLSGSLSVTCEDGALSVSAREVRLFVLLEAVESRCGIGIGRIDLGDGPVTVQTQGRLDEALRETLAQTGIQSYVTVYGQAPDGGDRLERLIVFGSPAAEEADSTGGNQDLAVLPVVQQTETPSVRFARAYVLERFRSDSEVPDGTAVSRSFPGQDERVAFLIRSVARQSLLGLAGLQAGDVLLNVNGVAIDGKSRLSDLLKGWGEGENNWGLRIDVLRDGQAKMLYLMANL